jgi:hypothetical protein
MDLEQREKAERTARWVVGAVVIIGYFAVILYMLFKDKSGVDILIGGLAAAFGAVVNFGFGSSAGSMQKTALLAKAKPVEDN